MRFVLAWLVGIIGWVLTSALFAFILSGVFSYTFIDYLLILAAVNTFIVIRAFVAGIAKGLGIEY